ncbi:MAG: MBL fold metallo-hydrolase [Oscillospiraceae bacterium]|jgi:phosphoribosyl 1,2-cyclic phosphodiesterase|nr:MBL fold metallo-hydrolase [Oscillospiraceae bacterium]
MIVCTLASGSDGNAVLIGYKDTVLLVDAGVSARRVKSALWELGVSEPACVLVTHEHGDHTRGLAALRRDVYAPPLTARAIRSAAPFLHITEVTGNFGVGDIGVEPFATPHDTPDSLGYLFDLGGFMVCVCTDLGHATKTVLEHACRADYLLIESNHDEGMVNSGRYPAFLKRRILSPRGHLSNEASAEVTLAAVKSGVRHVTLCHLSKENNRPELAESAATGRLSGERIFAGKDYTLNVAPPGRIGTALRR